MLKALKENLFFLSLMIVLVGTSSTEAYYASFGFKYQLLNLPSAHIFFRGLTAIVAFPILILLYLVALAAIAFQPQLALLLGGLDRLRWANHFFIAIFALLAWAGGEYAGHVAAMSDVTSDSSSLPLISKIDFKGDGGNDQTPISASQGYHLLLQTSEGVRIFKTVRDSQTESPLIKFIPSEAINGITICAHC